MEYLYRANDGTIFTDENDCIEYEQKLTQRNDLKSIFLDENGRRTTLFDGNSWVNDHVTFMIIANKDEADYVAEQFKEYGWEIDFGWFTNHQMPGRYFYNFDIEKWECFESLKDFYDSVAFAFGGWFIEGEEEKEGE